MAGITYLPSNSLLKIQHSPIMNHDIPLRRKFILIDFVSKWFII